MLDALEVVRETPTLRHRAWQLLNQSGRREEASAQAHALCRMGHANEREMLSLVRRTESFPFLLNVDEEPQDAFQPGLGMARWYFTQQQFTDALAELDDQRAAGWQAPAASALYGRLLAETQATDDFVHWYAGCSEDVQTFGDYWAALGGYLLHRKEYQPAAGALLRALERNPTDRITAQRLGSAFEALGDAETAAGFREIARQIDASWDYAEYIIRLPRASHSRNRLVKTLLELGRPFEAVQWTLLMLPRDARTRRAEMELQRRRLAQDPRALVMASQSAILGIDPHAFPVNQLATSPRAGSSRQLPPTPETSQPFAEPKLPDVAAEVGLDFQWYPDVETHLEAIPLHESLGAGIAVLDYDLDGWPDVYFAQGAGEPPSDQCVKSNEFFRNFGGIFRPVTRDCDATDFHYSAGLAAGDVNQDGFPDLFLGTVGRNRLLINNGDGTFCDETQQLGAHDDRFTSSVAIADLDGDARPDLFEANYLAMEGAFALPHRDNDGTYHLPSPLHFSADHDRWFRNLGDGRFELHEVGNETTSPGRSLGLMITDFDSDGSNEVFVAVDLSANHYLVRDDSGSWIDAAQTVGLANGFDGNANACMGIAAGDFNRDGRIDLEVTNYDGESVNLFLQTPSGAYSDLANHYGLNQLSRDVVGFGSEAVDLDRNGWLDILTTNGHTFDLRWMGHNFRMPPQMFMSDGRRYHQVELVGDAYWQGKYLGRSTATIDYDCDGAIDFLVNHIDWPVSLLHNETAGAGHWIQLELIGTRSERGAVGARVVVSVGHNKYTGWVTSGDGYYCSDQPLLDFGLGAAAGPATVEVYWPRGDTQRFDELDLGARYLIVEDEPTPYRRRLGF